MIRPVRPLLLVGISKTVQLNCNPAAPLAAALVAYFRGLPSIWKNHLLKPKNVKVLITKFQRSCRVKNRETLQFIWNGQVLHRNCMVDPHFLLRRLFCPRLYESMFESPNEPGPSCPIGNQKRTDHAERWPSPTSQVRPSRHATAPAFPGRSARDFTVSQTRRPPLISLIRTTRITTVRHKLLPNDPIRHASRRIRKRSITPQRASIVARVRRLYRAAYRRRSWSPLIVRR